MDVGFMPEQHNTPSPYNLVPRSILLAWLDVSQITGLADGDAVSSVADLAGGGRNWEQATAAYRPLYKVNQINGLPALDFDGSNDRISISHDLANTAFTYLIVAKAEATVTAASESTTRTDGLTGKRYLIAPHHKGANRGLGISLGTNYFQIYGHGDGCLTCYGQFGSDYSDWGLFIAVSDTRRHYMLYNGGFIRTALQPTQTIYASGCVGSLSYGAFDGKVAEYILLGSSNLVYITYLSSYLCKKYALTSYTGIFI